MPILDTFWSIRFGKKPEALTKIEALEATGSPLETTTVDILELENADLNATRNIAARAAINRPIAFRSPTRGERWRRDTRVAAWVASLPHTRGEVEAQALKEHGATYGIMPPTRGGGSWQCSPLLQYG